MCVCVCKAFPYGSGKQEVGVEGRVLLSPPLFALSQASESTNQIMIEENGHSRRQAGFLSVGFFFYFSSSSLFPLVCFHLRNESRAPQQRQKTSHLVLTELSFHLQLPL